MPNSLPHSVERDAHLALIQVHEVVSGQFRHLFHQAGLTEAQFNVLRILVQGSPDGESCGTIASRLIHRVPDVTRLVDRMQENGLVQRCRSKEDRRVVRICITEEGRQKCESLYQPLMQLNQSYLSVLTEKETTELNRLLRLVLAQYQTDDR